MPLPLFKFDLAARKAQNDIAEAFKVRRTTPMMGVVLAPPGQPTAAPQGAPAPPQQMPPGVPGPAPAFPQNPQMPSMRGLGGAYGTPQGAPAPSAAQRFARGGLAQAAEEDLSDQYNTPLSPTEMAVFDLWAQEHPRLANRYDYDAQGFWRDGGDIAPNGHGADTYKKRNHPTFSDESRYNGADGAYGGHWNRDRDRRVTSFTASNQNLRGRGEDGLAAYFAESEPDIPVLIPQSARFRVR